MQLNEFIKQSLIQVIEGIESANEALADKDATVNPRDVRVDMSENSKRYGWLQHDETFYRPVEKIKFDIAVTATEGTKTKGGVGVVAGVFALGTQGASDAENTSASRLEFEIPIVYPNGKVSSNQSE